MSCYDIPENVHPTDWLLTDCDNNLDSLSGGDPIAANQPPGSEPDFFDLHFGSGGSGATNRSEWSLADAANGVSGFAGPAFAGAGRLSESVGAMLSETSDPARDPLIDQGAPDYLLGGATGLTGAGEFAEGTVGVGNSKASSALSILSGINTFLTHDPNVEGDVSAWAERFMMGGTDALWGLAGGPTAVADSMTGGNAGGAMKLGVNTLHAAADSIAHWDAGNARRNFGNISNSITRDKFGAVAGWLGRRGESIGENLHLYEYGNDIPHLMARAGFTPPKTE